MNETSISPKEFLTQAEQKYGKKAAWIIKIALGLGGVGLLWLTGPAILAFLTTMVGIVGMAIVLTVLGVLGLSLYMFITNPKVQAMWRDQIDGFIQSCRQNAIKINPIDRLQAYADEYLQGKLDMVQGVKDYIKGKQNRHKDQVEQKEAEFADLTAQANARQRRSCTDPRNKVWKNDAQGKEDRDEFGLLSDQITLLKQSLARLEKMSARYELFMTLLEKYERAFNLSVRKTRNTVKVVSDEFEASQSMAEATQAMSGVMEGTDERTKLFDMTMDFVSQEIAGNVAQVENMFDRTRSIIASADLQSDMSEEKLLAELNNMGERTDQAITSLEAQGAVSVQDMVSRVRGADRVSVTTNVTATMPSGDEKYGNLLRKVRKN